MPTELLTGGRARELEPSLSSDIAAALWSPETGIIDSHALMEDLEKTIMESGGGELVYSSRVVRVDPVTRSSDNGEDGWVVQIVTGDTEDGDAILARTLINAGGLSAPLILNSLLSEQERMPMYYAKGSYASYSGPGIEDVSHLIYPCPETGENAHAFQSLGTHLTLDMQGKVRFGPDIQWISPPPDDSFPEASIDYWANHLVPDESRLGEMHRAVSKYLPRVQLDRLQPDYVGIRPKLVPPSGGFQDFVFRVDHPTRRTGGPNSMISLLGIESPGLTSCLSIAELVVDDMIPRDD